MDQQLDDRDVRAVLCRLVDAMREKGSWAGHTQVQKSVLFLQDLLGVPLGYRFYLYLHGPYCDELKEVLDDLNYLDRLGLEPHPGYGPSFFVTERGRKHMSPDEHYRAQIDFVAQNVATRSVRDLERIATAYFLITQDNGLSEGQIPKEINRLKPHITTDAATSALEEVKELKGRAKGALEASVG